MNKNKDGEKTTLNPWYLYIYTCFIARDWPLCVCSVHVLQGFEHLQ